MNLDQETATKIAQEWLDASAKTATDKDFDAHFNLISKKIRITGVPGHESVSYDDWARASEQEFKDNVLKAVTYEGFKFVANNERQVMFKTIENIHVNDGASKSHGVEILLSIEDDGVWRATQQRVMTDDETQHDGLM